jgi:hypothetical protein
MPEIGEIASGKDIGKKGDWDKFIYSMCPICGYTRWVLKYRLPEPKTERICPSCNCKRKAGDKHPHWKGGRHVNAQGYIEVWVAPDDIFYPMANHLNYSREHRLVMARYLGRCLRREEEVHHLNGIRTDNRIENLALTTNHNHNKKTLIQQLQKRIRALEQLHLKLEA